MKVPKFIWWCKAISNDSYVGFVKMCCEKWICPKDGKKCNVKKYKLVEVKP